MIVAADDRRSKVSYRSFAHQDDFAAALRDGSGQSDLGAAMHCFLAKELKAYICFRPTHLVMRVIQPPI